MDINCLFSGHLSQMTLEISNDPLGLRLFSSVLSQHVYNKLESQKKLVNVQYNFVEIQDLRTECLHLPL